MKMRTSQKVHYDSGPNMTPLVDVVMVLLIFLMLTGSFAASELILQSNMPLTQSGGGEVSVNNSIPQDEPVEINIRMSRDGMWIADVNGHIFTGDAAGMGKKKLEEHLSMTRERKQEVLRQAGRPVDAIQVTIIPDAIVQYQHLIDVYQSAVAARLEKIGFGTPRPRK